ncbi:MAG: ABC transporter permease [Oscillospiraceae bacterium]|nr:ABC transporter permease [Oscillospiraceae bacterium]
MTDINNKKLNFKKYIWIIFIIFLLIMSFGVSKISRYKYSDQNLDMIDLPPVLKIKKISSNYGVYIHKDLYPVLFNIKGEVKSLLKKIETRQQQDIYYINNKKLILDLKNIKDFKDIDYKKIKVIYNNKILDKSSEKLIWNRSYILGTDRLGRDIFTRVFQGIKISLIIGLMASIVNLIIGVLYGSIAGYFGGKIDTILLGLLNIINSIPAILLVILLSLFISQGLWSIIIIIGSVYWINMARQVRAGVMTLKQREFVLSEIVLGTPVYKIIFKYILPCLRETIVTTLVINIQNAIFTETFLSFLGIGLPAPVASLGTLINDAMGNLRSSPHQLVIPSLAILLILTCLEKFLNYK